MARANPRRDALAAQVRQAHRYAGQKVSKLERRQGLAIRREGLDPRRSYEGMSTRQLSRYLGELRTFNARGTNFVAGENGTPIPKALWRHYQQLERQNNVNADNYEANLRAGVTSKVPTLGRTPTEYIADRQGIDRVRARGQWRAFERIERDAGDIEGPAQLGKLIRAMEKRVAPDYLDNRARAERANLRKMLEATGDTGKGSLYNRVANMSNEQFLMLIDETDFMNRASGKYMFRDSGKPEWQAQVVEEYTAGMDELITWVRKQPKITPKSSGSANVKPEYTNTNAGTLPVQFNPRDTRVRSTPVQFDPLDTRARANPIIRPGRDKPKRKPD